MEKLIYDEHVYEKGAGSLYEILIKATFPGLIIGALQVGFVNFGLLTSFENIPAWAGLILMGVTIIYVVPCLFILPVSWFLRYSKSHKLEKSFVMVGTRNLEYHQAVSVTAMETIIDVYEVSHVNKIEKQKRKYILYGKVTDKNTGENWNQLEIPVAFKNMDKIERIARYR